MAIPKPSGSALTKMQELTSAWFFRRALNDNKSFKNVDEVMADEKFQNEIVGNKRKKGIYPFIDPDWLQTFLKQQKKYFKEFSDAKFKEFSVDGGFMSWVSKLVNTKYKINKKDSWDPADVWCIQNEDQVKKQITDAIDNSLSIEVLNAELRTLFQERKVVGISLKKVAKNEREARYQEVNIKEGVLFSSGKHPTFKINEIRCDLLLQKEGTVKANDSRIYFTVKYTKEEVKLTLTIRTSERTYRPGNLVFEFQEPGAAAQIGKAPAKLVEEAAKNHGMIFFNDWNKYPSTTQEYNTQIEDFSKEVDTLLKTKVKTGITSPKEAIKTIRTLLMDKDNSGTGNSKLMQIRFLYSFVKLGEKRMEKFITDLFFLAEKRGKGFGPFGKIY